MPKAGRAFAWGSAKRHRAVVGMAAMAAILTCASQSLAQEQRVGAAGSAEELACPVSAPMGSNWRFE